MWVPMYFLPWEDLSVVVEGLGVHPLNTEQKEGEPCGFLPVFRTREEAVEWAGNDNIAEIRTQSEQEESDAKPSPVDSDGVIPTEEDGLP